MRLGLLLLLTSLSACRCGSAPLRDSQVADWVVTPTPLVLPSVYVGQRSAADLTIDNLGGSAATAGVSIDAPFAPSLTTLTLGSGESGHLTLELVPTAIGLTTATLHLGVLEVPVVVEARAVPQCPSTVCSDGRFELERSECVSVAKADGAACDDGCVIGACHAGVCEGTINACDDGDRCTTDGCGVNGCIHVPLRCPGVGRCAAPACDAMTGCTAVEAPDGTLCGPDDCRANDVDVCIAGQCVTRPRPNEGRCVNTWVPGTLSGRSHHALAWDEARARVVLFGGYTSWGFTPQTWEWNGTVWEIRTPVASPPATYRPAMAFDLTRSRTVLVAPKNNHTSELWEWDGATWVLRSNAAASPTTHGDPNYESVGVAYDAAHRVTVVVVFRLGPSQPIETWEWNGTSWRRRTPATVPQLYYGAGHLVWDGTRQRVTLIGTSESLTTSRWSNAVWEWDGTDWSDRSSTATSIESWGTYQAAPAWDADRRELVMKGTGVTFIDDGSQWRWQPANGPEPRGGESPMVFDTARHQLVLFDGSLTWTLDGTRWTKITEDTSPRLVALVTDTVRQRVLGFQLDQPPLIALWQWQQRGWVQLGTTNAPPVRARFSVAFDSQRDRVVLVGGNETWEFDGTAWSKRLPAQQPPAREDASLAYDPIRQRVLLFGGHLPAGLALGDVWEWDGLNWQQRSTPGDPSPRYDAPMIWDSTGARLVLLAPPVGSTTIEAWSWTGAWNQVTPMTPPAAPSFVGALADDPVRHTLVGIAPVSFASVATWEFSSAGWTARTPTASPGNPFLFPMQGAAWDPIARQVVLSGTGETWLFLP